MLKQGSFINRKYYRLLVCNLIAWGVYTINLMADSIIGGNQLGETALTAVSIVAPITAVIYAVTLLFSPGFGILFAKRVGEFDAEYSAKLAGQNMLTALASGVLMMALLFLFKEPYLAYFGCTGELYDCAADYYNGMILYAVLDPVYVAVNYLVMSDGDAFCLMLGSTSEIITNVILSVVLCRRMGTAGLALSTCIAAFVGTCFYAVHFLRKTNGVHFRLHWSWRDMLAALGIGSSRAVTAVFIAVVDIIMNKIILRTCGVAMIPAYSVINLAFNVYMLSGAAFDSCAGFCSTFVGERNNYGIRSLMKTCAKTLLGIGIFLTLVFFFCAPLIPALYGMETPEVIEASVSAARIMAVCAIPYCYVFFGFSIYAALGRPSFSFLLAVLYNLLCPLLLSVPFAYLWGFSGVSVGMSLSTFLVVAVFVVIVIAKYGKKGFPLYLEDYGEETVAFDVCVNQGSIVPLRDGVVAELAGRGFEIENIDLLIEELFTRIREKNPGKTILAECLLLFGEKHVRLIVRDNGVIFNFVDENNRIESLNAHVLNSLLEQTKDKNYLLTTSFNRNGFEFEKDCTETAVPC